MTRRLVLVHRYFSPDTPPYASILRDIAEHLGSDAREVTVLTCQPSYNRAVVSRAPSRERLGPHVSVVRWPVLDDRRSSALKVVNMVWFCVRVAFYLLRMRDVDTVMAASTPPVAVAAVTSWAARRKGASFVYHKQDIYPEVVVATTGSPSRWYRALRWADARTDRSASQVVVLSQDMADTTARRGVPVERISVINNFDPWHLDESGVVPSGRPIVDGQELEVVFAGNLGRFQNLEPVFEAVEALAQDPVNFHFFGDGVLRQELAATVDRLGLSRVHLYGYRSPHEVASFLLERAHLGIVSLVPGVIRAAYPSKTMSYLRQGTPILALVEGDSELAETVRAHQIGRQVEPGDVKQLVAVLRDLARAPGQLDGAGARARALYEEEFSRSRRLNHWSRLFDEVAT